MSALAFAGEMASLQQAIAESHDLAVRRGVVLAALNLRTGERVLEVGCGMMEPRPPTLNGQRPRPSFTYPLRSRSAGHATIDTDAPGTCVSATIWRFNPSEYCRRLVVPGCCFVSTNPLVDTCSDPSAIR